MINLQRLMPILLLIGASSLTPIATNSGTGYQNWDKQGTTFGKSGAAYIIIGGNIKDSFPCAYTMLKNAFTHNTSVFASEVFKFSWRTDKDTLIFVDKELPDQTAGETGNGHLNDGKFKDTIFINKKYLKEASKEYLISVIIHERIHAFIHWCCLSYNNNKLNGVTTKFLRRHFRNHWEWLTYGPPFINPDSQHIVMTDNFYEQMAQNIYNYTNPISLDDLRHGIAYSLAWGGLDGTPKWKNLKVDTCAMLIVIGWSRNVHATARERFSHGKCDTTDRSVLEGLQLRSPCQ